MMVTDTLTVADLERRLNDVLDRVRRGEQFSIERDGEVIAMLSPASKKSGITVRELVAQIGDLQMPGDGFADDLEAIQAEQGWPRYPNGPTDRFEYLYRLGAARRVTDRIRRSSPG